MEYEKLVYYDNEAWRSCLVKDCSFICKEDAIVATIENIHNSYKLKNYLEKEKQVPEWCERMKTVYVLNEERFCYVKYVMIDNPIIVFCCDFSPSTHCTWYELSELRPAENTMFSDRWSYQRADGVWVEVAVDANKRAINPDLEKIEYGTDIIVGNKEEE